MIALLLTVVGATLAVIVLIVFRDRRGKHESVSALTMSGCVSRERHGPVPPLFVKPPTQRHP